MNIYDISARAGVSIATVSRVLNGSRKVSEATRRKITDIIEETGYAPGTGRQKRPMDARTVGVLCTSLLPRSNAVTVEKLIRKFHSAGYDTDLALCGSALADKRRAVEHFTDKKINALIIQGADFMEYKAADNAYLAAAAARFPIVLLNAFLDAPGVYCALCDLTSAIQSVTDALIKKGRRRPMFLFPAMSEHYLLMLEGFQNTCAANGIESPPEYVHLCPDPDSAQAYVRAMLSGGLQADAAVTTDDASAAAVLRAAKEAGLSLPDDFEATGCGMSRIAAFSLTPFITINCREEELCAHAVSCVTNLSKGAETATKTVFPAMIVNN